MKKYSLFMILLLLSSFFMFKVSANNHELLGKIIYIDPGHGGVDPGAVYKNVKEEDITLSIALILKEKMENKGAIVYLTRTGDYDLSNGASNRKKTDLYKRSELINQSNTDLYLSIHLNADTSPTWNGAQVFYNNINKKNIIIANYIQKSLKKELKTDRKTKEKTTDFLYKSIKKPGVLIEVGFLSNPSERILLQKREYQSKIASAIISGLEKYFYES